MHVLAISYGRNLFTPGGVERERQAACAQAVDALHMVVFMRAGKDAKVIHDGHLHLYPSGGRSRLGMLWGAYRTAATIIASQRKAQWVVTAQDPFEAGFIGWRLARRFGVPLNIQEHGDFFSTNHWREESWLNYVRYYFGGWLLRRADTVRVVSERISTTLQSRGVLAARLRLLPVAISLQKFLAVTAKPAAGDVVTIVSVARFVPQKNLALLIAAFAAVSHNVPAARLLLVGSGAEETTLRALAASRIINHEAVVQWLPWSDNVPALLARSHIYALSSNYEGYARVVPEAMATGLPVLMTDVGCAHEVLTDKETGLIVPVGDSSAFTQALQHLVRDTALRERLGQAARISVQAQLKAQQDNYGVAWREALTIN